MARPWLVPTILIFTAGTLARLAVAALTPLSPDECYYWIWSRAPAGGYLDHPPMVAEWIRLGTWLAGDTPLGVRLLAPLSAAIGTVALARAGRDLLGSWREGAAAAWLLNATLLFGVGGVTMTPDTPLLFFWTLTLAAIARLIATGNGLYWLPAGAMAGLAMDSKYTAILLGPALLAWLLAARGMRVWLGRWPLWAGLALALAAMAGVVLWNADHGWASFAKQGGRADAWQPARAAQFLGELVGGQVGLATPLVFLLCAVGSGASIRRLRDPAHGLLAALTAIPALVFVEHALGDRVQANWPAIIYPAGCLAVAGLGGAWRRLRAPAVALGGIVTLLVWAQGMASPLPLPRALDPTLMRLGGWRGLAADLAVRAASERAAFVAADNYGLAGELALLMPPATPVVGVEQRWAFFALPSGDATLAGRTGLLLRSTRRADPPDPAPWSRIEKLGEIARARDGVVAETYGLYLVTGRPGSKPISAVLPRPG
jgi:4-amino-4-deoxy-L-arabinose transferase-like glycosyltransferase